jgi:tRNA G10  N-methylase Trm11
MKYKIERNNKYDFLGQSYSTKYPNLHRYPATMIPQIGIEILKELNIKNGRMLDPYCGSGSSFASGLEIGISDMFGFDINPFAVLLSKAKFTKIDINELSNEIHSLRSKLHEFIQIEENLQKLEIPYIKNIDFWYSKETIQDITALKYFIYKIQDENIKRLMLIPFVETARECSYTRNSEFKLFRMKPEEMKNFKPYVYGLYFSKLKKVIQTYQFFYYPKLNDNVKITVEYKKFEPQSEYFDVVLTSPPYGDSRTTVAYGQFSNFANEWLDIDYARQIDSMLMGGKVDKKLYNDGVISEYIQAIKNDNEKRAYEVSAFYRDLEISINKVASSVKKNGFVIYVVGNRTVKNIMLPTDQFIAEKFEKNGFKHLITYERLLSNKVMPSKNSPSNITGETVNTMLMEYIVVCQKN